MNFAHLTIGISIFFLTLSFCNLLPGILVTYRERYQINVSQTTRELDKFFLNIKPTQVLIGGAVLGAVLVYFTGSWVAGGFVVLLSLFAPRIILSVWKDIRSSQFDAQLMDALILMGNSLKSGLDIAAGIERIATTMKPPVSEEFGLVLNAYRLGTPLETALVDMTDRIKSRTLETVIYAITIQRETGGNIIKTFDQLVNTIREESKLQKKIRAITSQARTQIYFMAGFPWAVALFLAVMAPDFITPALANSWTQLVVVFLILWEVIGILVTNKIAAVEV